MRHAASGTMHKAKGTQHFGVRQTYMCFGADTESLGTAAL